MSWSLTALPLVIAGPTGTGKSALALALAEKHGGSLICGDSRQVYAGMQVGAAGPDDAERARVPHLGYGVVDPADDYDAARFIDDVIRAHDDVRAAGRWPIVVGGAGMYLRALRFGLSDVPGRDDAIRARLEAEIETRGTAPVHARLAEIDPASAAEIDVNDPVRIVRALEIFEVSGIPASAQRRSHGEGPPAFVARWLLLEADRSWLIPRIGVRAAAMFAGGLKDEVRALADRFGPAHKTLRTMGYEEALEVIAEGRDEDDAIARVAIRQRQYARRQRTWFRKEPWWTRVDAAAPGLLETSERTLLADDVETASDPAVD